MKITDNRKHNTVNIIQLTEDRKWNLKSIPDSCSSILNSSCLRAFTLIETMVGIMIITTAIIGPLSVAVGAASYAKDTKDKVTAIYLAQEAVDLLRFERDSLVIKCNQEDGGCVFNDLYSEYGIESFETTSNSAWRMFKERLSTAPSCFVTDNGGEPGCAFDFNGLTKNTSSAPVKYSPNVGCDYLYRDDTGVVANSAYLCRESDPLFEDKHKTKFKRVIKLKSVSSNPNGNAYFEKYNDDVLINVTVTYDRKHGFPAKPIIVTDFLHAKI